MSVGTPHFPDDDRKFWVGEMCFDLKRTDPTDSILVVTNPHVGTLSRLKRKDLTTYNHVTENADNRQLIGGRDLPNETRCVEAAYANSDEAGQVFVGDATYTFPSYRLARIEEPNEDGVYDGHRPMTAGVGTVIAHLARHAEEKGLQSADDVFVALMKGGFPGKALAAAADEE